MIAISETGQVFFKQEHLRFPVSVVKYAIFGIFATTVKKSVLSAVKSG